MRRTLVCLLLVVTTVTAAAQPGQTPPPQPYPQPQPQPYYPPQPYYAQPPQQPLTAEEMDILEDGPISDGAHFVGAAAALFIGFGSGQAIQGRWGERGWIFTVGEVASYVLILSSMPTYGDGYCEYDCYDDEDEDMMVIGVFALIGFRLWGTIDAISGPASHNRRYRQVRAKAGFPAYYYGAAPYIVPATQGTGATAGVTFRF